MTQSATIRHAVPSDSAGLVELMSQLDQESRFLLFEPGERSLSVERQVRFIEETKESQDKILLAAVGEGQVVGFLGGQRQGFCRRRHVMSMAMGVLAGYQRRGIGRALLAELDTWALQHDVSRIEFTVVQDNRAAIGLYLACGYRIEGTRPRSMRIDGAYVDEYYVAKTPNLAR